MTDNSAGGSRGLRDLLGHFATGVAVITTRTSAGERLGVTVNSFSSVSLEPELVLFSLTRELLSLPAFRTARAFGINFLADDQQALSNRFAQRGSDKWRDVAVREGELGVPLLDGALAHLECTPHELIEAGDHLIFLARVHHYDSAPAKAPLLFFKGRYHALDAAPPPPAMRAG